MNFKDMKKVHEDEEKAVFRNTNGHEFRIAKKGLRDAGLLKKLKELPLHAAEGDVIEEPGLGDSEEPVTEPESIHPPMSLPINEPASGIAPKAEAPESEPATDIEKTEPQNPNSAEPVPEPAAQQPQAPQPPTPGDSLVDQMQKVGSDLMTNQINKKTYQDLLFKDEKGNDKSFIGKIGSLFGLLVAGAGAGLSHQSNAVISMMDKEIANDLESQKQNQGNRLSYFGLLNNAIKSQSENSKNYADVAHLAAVDGPTLDALTQAHARRDSLDKLYQEQVLRYPEGSPQRQKAESTFSMLSNAANVADQSAAAFVNGRWALYNNQPGMIGGPGSGPAGAPAKPNDSKHIGDGIDYQKWNKLKSATSQKLPLSPSESDMDRISKEAVEVKEARQIRKTYIESFNQLNKAFAAGRLDPNQRAAAINALGAKMATLTSHRYNAGEAAAQAEGMFPAANDWGGQSGKTRQIKYENGLKAIDALESGTPTLDFYKLKSPAPYPPLEQSAAHEKHPPDGTPVMTQSGRKAEWRGGKKVYVGNK